MNVKREASDQLLVDGPMESVREAVWYALEQQGLKNLVIDTEKSQVVGATGGSMTSYGRDILVLVESAPDGIYLTTKSTARDPGTIDFGKRKRHSKKLTDGIEQFLRDGVIPEKSAVSNIAAAPIASPFGEKQFASSGPVYGPAPIPKKGAMVMSYGLMGLFCCQIFGPVAWIYGSKALRSYGKEDPGDRILIYIGMGLGMFSTAMVLLFILFCIRTNY